RVLHGDESPQVRYAAATSLRRIGDGRALPALQHASIHDSSELVRTAALQAVQSIKR
ncbi:MAG: HEAT repeat domain-containing protein, partial [Thermoanaerobaculia bacterium]